MQMLTFVMKRANNANVIKMLIKTIKKNFWWFMQAMKEVCIDTETSPFLHLYCMNHQIMHCYTPANKVSGDITHLSVCHIVQDKVMF